MVRKVLVSCLLLLSFSPLYAQEGLKWKARAGYVFQDMNFTSNAHGANFQLSYDEPQKWGVRGGFNYINKFGDSAPGYSVGGTYWATKTTTLSLDANFAPQQVVVPRQSYTFEVSQALFKVLVPSLAYRFADYTSVNAHTIMPAVTWYFYPRFDWMVRYFLNISQFSGSSSVKHSVMTRINWNVVDPLVLFAGYARSNDSFESGNPVAPLGGFSANHAFGGLKWEFYKGLGMDFSLDYENRNNGQTVKAYEAALFYRW